MKQVWSVGEPTNARGELLTDRTRLGFEPEPSDVK